MLQNILEVIEKEKCSSSMFLLVNILKILENIMKKWTFSNIIHCKSYLFSCKWKVCKFYNDANIVVEI